MVLVEQTIGHVLIVSSLGQIDGPAGTAYFSHPWTHSAAWRFLTLLYRVFHGLYIFANACEANNHLRTE